MASEAPEVTARLAAGFHRSARAVRQIIALKAKMARDALIQSRDEQALAAEAARAPLQARRERIEATLMRVVRSQSPAYRIQTLSDDVRTRLDEETLLDDFLDEDVGEQIQRLCKALGFRLDPDDDVADEDDGEHATPSRRTQPTASRFPAPNGGGPGRDDGYG